MAPASCAASILWVMPPIGPTLPSPEMVPVPATNFAVVEVAGGELVDDGQAEHQPRRRAADVGEVEVDGERRPRRVQHRDPEEAVVAVGVGAQRDGGDARPARSCGGSRATTLSPGLVAFSSAVNCSTVGDRLAVHGVDRVAALQLARRRAGIVDASATVTAVGYFR